MYPYREKLLEAVNEHQVYNFPHHVMLLDHSDLTDINIWFVRFLLLLEKLVLERLRRYLSISMRLVIQNVERYNV